MRRAGFYALNLSLGSSDDRQLKKFKRPNERPAFERALTWAEQFGMVTVGYVLIGAPGQDARASIKDLLYLADKRTLAGLSVYYPAPGSEDYAASCAAELTPPALSLYRSTALPVSPGTTRLEAVTLLRLGRIINFYKHIIDSEQSLPIPAPLLHSRVDPARDRVSLGLALVAHFFSEGQILGVTSAGEIYEHESSGEICQELLAGLKNITVRGASR
jgi:anaerobic magnesium-protoporphyrin IX monomethyl ester cyclase